MSKRLARSVPKWLLALLLTPLLLAATLLLLLRLGMPLLAQAEQEIAQRLSQRLGSVVRIEQLSPLWLGKDIGLRAKSISLGDGAQALRIRGAQVRLLPRRLPAALYHADPFSALELSLPELNLGLHRTTSGNIEIVGLPSSGDSLPLKYLLPYQLRLDQLQLNWQDDLASIGPVPLPLMLVLILRDPMHLDVTARTGQTALLRGAFTRDSSSAPWRGRSYLHAEHLRLPDWLRRYLPEAAGSASTEGFQLSGKLWGDFNQSGLDAVQGHWQVQSVNSGNATQSKALQGLRAELQLRRSLPDTTEPGQASTAWQLQLNNLAVQLANQHWWQPEGLALSIEGNPTHSTVHLRATSLGLPKLNELAEALPLPEQFTQQLRQLQPHGQLHELRALLPLQATQDWAFSARFSDLTWQASAPAVPGVSGFSGQLMATQEHTSVDLDSRQITLDLGTLMRQPLHLQQLQGRLHLQALQDGWRLTAPELKLSNQDLKAELRVRSEFGGEAPALLHLLARATDGDVSATSRYLPTRIMSPKLVQWLDHSLSSGRMEQASVLFSGPLQDYPYRGERSGNFEVLVDGHSIPLNYRDDWPPLEQATARLYFHQASLDIELLEGRILGLPIQQASAHIQRLDPTSPLELQAKVNGPLRQQIKALESPALRQRLGELTQVLQVAGEGELSLDLSVVLKHGNGEDKLDGRLRLIDASLHIDQPPLDIRKIAGELRFDLHSLNADHITGLLDDRPVYGRVQPRPDGTTEVVVQARLGEPQLRQQLPGWPAGLAQGDADFDFTLGLGPRQAGQPRQVSLQVDSNLNGLSLELPEPLGKSVAQSRNLHLELSLAGSQRPLRLRYADKLSAEISQDLQRADLRYQRGQASLPSEPIWQLEAHLPELDIGAWAGLAARLQPAASPTAHREHPQWQAHIQADRLQLGKLQQQQASIEANHRSGKIEADFETESAKGRLSYDRETRYARVSLDRLAMQLDTQPEDATKNGPTQTQPAPPPLDPRGLPNLELTVHDLRLSQAQLGRLDLAAQPSDDGVILSLLQLSGPLAEVSLQGAWSERDGRAYSRLGGSLKTPGLGQLLSQLGLTDALIEAPASVDVDLKWEGPPYAPQVAELHGTASHIQVQQGALIRLDPGFGRLLGLLSIDALGRRAKLDFSDLTDKGFSFDRIGGAIHFDHGLATTDNLTVEGPFGRIKVAGDADLVARTQNLYVGVTPDMEAALPLITTLAGGPAAGLVALVAQRLLESEVDDIKRFDYRVTGPWDEPEVLSQGGALSRAYQSVTGKRPKQRASADSDQSLLDESR